MQLPKCPLQRAQRHRRGLRACAPSSRTGAPHSAHSGTGAGSVPVSCQHASLCAQHRVTAVPGIAGTGGGGFLTWGGFLGSASAWKFGGRPLPFRGGTFTGGVSPPQRTSALMAAGSGLATGGGAAPSEQAVGGLPTFPSDACTIGGALSGGSFIGGRVSDGGLPARGTGGATTKSSSALAADCVSDQDKGRADEMPIQAGGGPSGTARKPGELADGDIGERPA
eukprot:CAMPEP_0179326082 /NCGR_PEP_ID=MMETSP0797-20121207/61238_1 /TAXON_ID=47934 /ORGANISM="Dinophysis acuminata, Strain DAEP01" /LENGTH=223 /DNA_ID=CAMNT_0021038315 /DNA_START=67 /DNA_END=734 /DNA_ORIENTATION=-